MSLKQWNILHSIAILGSLIIFHVTGLCWPVLFMAFLSLILLWVSQWYTISHLKPVGGYGNLVTLLRYLLIILIVAISPLWPLPKTGLLFIIPVSLDALDGFLARRMNQQSKFGALFDMETDSLFMALTGLILFHNHIVGAWLLPAVYLRYFYILILTIFRLNNIPEKRTQFGPAVTVFMFISLIAACIYPIVATKILLIMATVLVIVSFGYSFIGILSQRPPD